MIRVLRVVVAKAPRPGATLWDPYRDHETRRNGVLRVMGGGRGCLARVDKRDPSVAEAMEARQRRAVRFLGAQKTPAPWEEAGV